MVARQHYRWDFIGLSTDNKPTPATSEKVVDGSTFYCSDNSKLYVWYNDQWYEKVVSGGGGGGSYTAGDGIDITNDVISATNTGKARVLTTADYNYPANNPNCVALWLLEPGFYIKGDDDPVTRYGNGYTSLARMFIIGKEGGNYKCALAMRGSVNADNWNVVYYVMRPNGSTPTELPILDRYFVEDNLNSSDGRHVLSAAQGKVLKDLVDSLAIRGAGAPTTSTVGQVGTLYEDTTNGDLYICTDATNPYVWEEVGAGGGGGPTVVQTTGTSTTDVMSQNATTSMVFADPATAQKVSIGATQNNGSYAVAVGYQSQIVSGNRGVALGYRAETSANGAVAIGTGANAATVGEVNIGSSSTAYGYNNSNYRLLSGLYDGQSAHDAATVGQITPLTDSVAPTSATAGRLGEIRIDTTTNTAYMCVLSDSATPTYEWKQITA